MRESIQDPGYLGFGDRLIIPMQNVMLIGIYEFELSIWIHNEEKCFIMCDLQLPLPYR